MFLEVPRVLLTPEQGPEIYGDGPTAEADT